jgi:hypothetical protein
MIMKDVYDPIFGGVYWVRMKTVGNGRKRTYDIEKTKTVGSGYFYI